MICKKCSDLGYGMGGTDMCWQCQKKEIVRLRSQLAACVSVLRECRASLDADLPNAAELDAKLAALLEGKTNV